MSFFCTFLLRNFPVKAVRTVRLFLLTNEHFPVWLVIITWEHFKHVTFRFKHVTVKLTIYLLLFSCYETSLLRLLLLTTKPSPVLLEHYVLVHCTCNYHCGPNQECYFHVRNVYCWVHLVLVIILEMNIKQHRRYKRRDNIRQTFVRNSKIKNLIVGEENKEICRAQHDTIAACWHMFSCRKYGRNYIFWHT